MPLHLFVFEMGSCCEGDVSSSSLLVLTGVHRSKQPENAIDNNCVTFLHQVFKIQFSVYVCVLSELDGEFSSGIYLNHALEVIKLTLRRERGK